MPSRRYAVSLGVVKVKVAINLCSRIALQSPHFSFRKENGNSVNILLVLRYDPWGAVEPLSWYPPRCRFQTQRTIFRS